MIEAASEACSVALFAGGECIAGDWRMLGRGHAEALVPMIAALPGRGRARAVAVGLGPGSFTGVRIGLAAARALGLAWGVPVRGYPTLALIAAMARAEPGAPAGTRAPPCLVATTAGHGEWFVAGYDGAGHETRALAALRPDAAALDDTALIAGSQAEALVARRGHGVARALWPDARAFLRLGTGALRADLAPLYGRAPDARPPAGALTGAAAPAASRPGPAPAAATGAAA